MEVLRQGKLLKELNEDGYPIWTDIPITLSKEGDIYSVDIDGVVWLKTENLVHSVVMFEMLQDNVTEYVTYRKL